MKNNDWSNAFAGFALSILFLGSGIYMITNNLIAAGRNSRTLNFSAFGGHLLIFGGLIFLFVSYYSLSPYNKIREFFEKDQKKVKRRKSRLLKNNLLK